MIRPRKITKAEIKARLIYGKARSDDITEAFNLNGILDSELTKLDLKLSLIGRLLSPFRLVDSIHTRENDTISYSNILKCIKGTKRDYPKEIYEEMEDAGIIDNFYEEACIDCLGYDDCHTRPYKK